MNRPTVNQLEAELAELKSEEAALKEQADRNHEADSALQPLQQETAEAASDAVQRVEATEGSPEAVEDAVAALHRLEAVKRLRERLGRRFQEIDNRRSSLSGQRRELGPKLRDARRREREAAARRREAEQQDQVERLAASFAAHIEEARPTKREEALIRHDTPPVEQEFREAHADQPSHLVEDAVERGWERVAG